MYIAVLCCVPFGMQHGLQHLRGQMDGQEVQEGIKSRGYSPEGHSTPRRCVSRVGWWLRLAARQIYVVLKTLVSIILNN